MRSEESHTEMALLITAPPPGGGLSCGGRCTISVDPAQVSYQHPLIIIKDYFPL